MPKIDTLISAGRSGMMFFIFINLLASYFSFIFLHGSELIINVVIHGVLALALAFGVEFLVKYPIKVLTLALVICSLDSFRYVSLKLSFALKNGEVRGYVFLIIMGGLRLIALWAIWISLGGIKSIMRNQVIQRDLGVERE